MSSLSKRIVNVLPSALKEVAKVLKKYDSEKLAESITEATSLSGLLIGVFAQPIAENYLSKKAKKTKGQTLKDFGFHIYLEASFENAEAILLDLLADEEMSIDLKDAAIAIQKAYDSLIAKLNTEDYILVFKPLLHPAVKFVREGYVAMLTELNLSIDLVNQFQKRYNLSIEELIVKKFGSHYEEHLKDVHKNWLVETEIDFLQEMKSLSRIGFKEDEDLEYQQAYGSWEDVDDLLKKEDEDLDREKKLDLKEVENLIDEYFKTGNPDKHIEKICFLISDFGKGKSIFLNQYASNLAKSYLDKGSGYFPIYFNLREFGVFSKNQSRLGIIDDFLQIRHSIKISDEHFMKKEFVFLLDSLDESGEINDENIQKVIESIKYIQRLDPTKSFRNKIIISSRPFDEGLKKHITGSFPYTTIEEDRECYYYISIFGFRKNQFNQYLYDNLGNYSGLENIKTTGFAYEVVKAILSKKQIDIHEHLLKNGTLSVTELRRPIFAYMILMLIKNNVDFASLGKIGVYLSFLNLLTKEAKHIESKEVKVNLKEEFKYRNILHATAALWMYERQKGNQGILNKADICRTIKGEQIDEDDKVVLKEYKEVEEVKFFSHSYFGVQGSKLHFQHQSFAEILLAEYYLKVIIKYALDENEDWEEARVKLVLGEPTEQTIEFLIELINLLKESSVEKVTKEVIEKRKLLFPLLASCATKDYNTIFSNSLFYKWYSDIDIKEGQRSINQDVLKKWVITKVEIEKISELCKKIVTAEKSILLSKSILKSSLFNNEVSLILSENKPPDVEKWIALIIGNNLENDLKNEIFFNHRIKETDYFFQLLKNWNHYSNSPKPYWAQTFLFLGIRMENNDNQKITRLAFLNLSNLDFGYSYLRSLIISNCNLTNCNFQKCTFDNFIASENEMHRIDFRNILIIENTQFNLALSTLAQGVFFPERISMAFYVQYSNNAQATNEKIYSMGVLSYLGVTKCIYKYTSRNKTSFEHRNETLEKLLNSLDGIICHLLKFKLLTLKQIEECFEITDDETQTFFFEKFHSRFKPVN